METITATNKTSLSSTKQEPITMLNGSVFKLRDLTSTYGIKLLNLVFDLPGEKVNKFDERVIREFEPTIAKLEEMGKKHEIDVLVLTSAKTGNFIAGADIKLIQAAKTAEDAAAMAAKGQALLNRWDDLPFPTVVAIDGTCLGGGCELSLASSAIVMSANPAAKIGLPEVMLGVLPGMGGCVRLPQKVGLATALDMILTGKTLDGAKAYKSGLADACIPTEGFEEYAFKWVKANLKDLQSGKRIARMPKLGGMGGIIGKVLEITPFGRNMIFGKAKQGVLSKTRGQYPAPLEAIAVIQSVGTGWGKKFRGDQRNRALDREAKGFGKLAAGDVCKNLIRLFFLTENIKKANGLVPHREVKTPPIKSTAVLGAGVMGGGIAQLFSAKEYPTRMKDINLAALEIGMKAAEKLFRKSMKRRKITKRQYLQSLNRIAPTLDYSGFGNVDAVVEAVVENMDIKKKVFAELENHIKPECVVASNTSSLSLSQMQSGMKHPERVVGMHFFNPVHKMPLIEVIRGKQTSDEAVVEIFELSKKLGKFPIVVKDSAGFLVNRLLVPYLNEASFILLERAPIPQIDRAMLDFGMPMGPMELIDEVGVDVGEKVLHILHDAFGDRMKPAEGLGKVVKLGRLGKKSGKGVYTYPEGKKTLDPEVYKIIGVEPQENKLTDLEIVERCIFPMINEAARCLDDGVVASPSDVDLGMIMGTGFPPFRGGLLRYADSIGCQKIVERLQAYQRIHGMRFEPCASLLRRAEKNEKFYND